MHQTQRPHLFFQSLTSYVTIAITRNGILSRRRPHSNLSLALPSPDPVDRQSSVDELQRCLRKKSVYKIDPRPGRVRRCPNDEAAPVVADVQPDAGERGRGGQPVEHALTPNLSA